MLKNLPIIPSRTSQNLSLLFFKIPPIILKLFIIHMGDWVYFQAIRLVLICQTGSHIII